jgi:glycosyltransferase involved in cell wall biosynthesis
LFEDGEMTNKSILMIGNYLPATRWNKNVWHYLAENLAEMGWHVIITSSKISKPFRLIDMLTTVWKYRHTYQLAQIDVFSGKAFLFAEACTHLLKALQKPVILTLHGGGLSDYAISHPKRMADLLKRADILVTPSLFLKNELAHLRSDSHLIPNPIDISAAIYRPRQQVSPNLIWARAFHKIYNPGMAVRVVAALKPEFPEIHLTMLGPDKTDGSLPHIQRAARDLDLIDHIEIIGIIYHIDIPRWLDKADIFINTSNYDTAPRSLLEAMANGMCIISTDVGGIPYLVNHGENGLLVPQDDHQAMTDAVRQVLTNPSLASHLSENARKTAENYDWSAVLPLWETVLLEGIKNAHGQT